MTAKFFLGIAQALTIAGITWLMAGMSELKVKVAILEIQKCHCGQVAQNLHDER